MVIRQGYYKNLSNYHEYYLFLLKNVFNLDIDECEDVPCDQDANCTNTAGSYLCECIIGYTGNGTKYTGMNIQQDYYEENQIYQPII